MSDDTVQLVIKLVGKITKLDNNYRAVYIINLLKSKLLNLYLNCYSL